MRTSKKEILANDRNAWVPGFTVQAELWNGRFAMLGFVVALAIKLASKQGLIH